MNRVGFFVFSRLLLDGNTLQCQLTVVVYLFVFFF